MNKKENIVKLRLINNLDYKFLYDLLKNRDPRANISHKKTPTYKEHVKFVKSKPYTKWYIIEYEKNKVGSIYLSKVGEIGIFLKKGKQKKNIGTTALTILIQKNPRKRYLANVNPKNIISKRFFIKNRFHLLSYTYELEN